MSFLPKRTAELGDYEEGEENLRVQLPLPKLDGIASFVKSVERVKLEGPRSSSLRKSHCKWAPKRTHELAAIPDPDTEELPESQKNAEKSPSSPITRLKERGREVLGLLNGRALETPQPGVFRNMMSPVTEDVFMSSIYEKVEEDNEEALLVTSIMGAGNKVKEAMMTSSFEEFKIRVGGSKFVIREVLGRGGSATVFSGFQGDTPYAVKVMEVGSESDKIGSFRHEVELLRSLRDVPHVIGLVESDLQDDLAFIVMECGTCDLYKHLLTYSTDIPLFKIASWFRDMTLAIEAIHRRSIIHADLKPSNYLVMSNGRLKLTDFGISKVKQRLSDPRKAQPEVALAGTINFLCPETVRSIMQRRPPSVSEGSDIWSLGVIFYYLLYKELPFQRIGDRQRKLAAMASPQNVLQFGPLVRFYPEILLDMCKACLQYRADLRPSAAALLADHPLDMIVPEPNV